MDKKKNHLIAKEVSKCGLQIEFAMRFLSYDAIRLDLVLVITFDAGRDAEKENRRFNA